VVHGDPLDKVTGTEGWSRAPESPEAEWKEWLRGRRAWRRGGRELRVQRAISERLARLALGGGGLDWGEVRRVIESGLRSSSGRGTSTQAPQRPAPGGRSSREPTSADGHLEYEPDADPSVPVERLDQSGQGVDDETDEVLRPPARPSKGRRPGGKKRAP